MQPVGNRCSMYEESDPPEVFCSLGCLIVEGRVPSHDVERGYAEGPHVPPARNLPTARHICTDESFMCKRDKSFRKHLLLLWQNSIPISIEVLLCPECRFTDKKSLSVEFSSVPEPSAVLLEQWTISVYSQSSSENPINSRGLFQAVRSFLHFSQLSAWYSSSKGQKPKNVLYRITIPGENFSTKFSQHPNEHFFPPAAVGQSSCIYVSVRSLPRSSEIPRIDCPHVLSPQESDPPSSTTTTTAECCQQQQTQQLQLQPHQSVVTSPDGDEKKLPMAGALSWKDSCHTPETDLRKAIVKTRLAECVSELYRSDSSDSILSDSLLDPPQSLQKIPPKRYQSPSRCGSPSHEAPDYLLFGSNASHFRKRDDIGLGAGLVEASAVRPSRQTRQDLLRRRDLNQSLHPKVLAAAVGGHLAFPPKRDSAKMFDSRNLAFRRSDEITTASSSDTTTSQLSSTDSWETRDESDLPGPSTSTASQSWHPQQCSLPTDFGLGSSDNGHPAGCDLGPHLGAKSKQPRKLNNDSLTDDLGDDDEEVMEYPTEEADAGISGCSQVGAFPYQQEMKHVLASLSPKGSACSSRRSSIMEEESFGICAKRKTVKPIDDIFDDGSASGGRCSQQKFYPVNTVTQVYRAETSSPLMHQASSATTPPFEKADSHVGAIHPSPAEPKKLYGDWYEPQSEEDASDRGYCGRLTPMSAHQRSLPKSISTSGGSFVRPFDLSSFEDENSLEEQFQRLDPWERRHRDDEYQRVKTSYQEIRQIHNGQQVNQHNINLNGSLYSFNHCTTNNNNNNVVPTPDAVNTFLKSFDSAKSMVFHRRTGLPLTSSPAPLRRGKGKFDFDSAIASPHDIKRALFSSQLPDSPKKTGNEEEEDTDDKENTDEIRRRRRHSQKLLSASAPATVSATNLLCNFEESVLNGRLEPVSTVEGFTAEIGASGSFHPKHTILPVTVFFYTLCDNATVSSPYLGHINLGKKGYRVPQKGTIQVTLFNPLGTVVKMFVVMYDLSDMPPNSQTFLRQRTLYMPSDLSEANAEDAQKWLRYLIHLRFASSKSGKISLHTDLRMIIFRKSDLDTATDHNPGKGYELRSFTRGPTNPKFSPRR